MKASEIKKCPVKNGWHILPNGNRVSLGNDVRFGNRVTLGNGVELGDDVVLGDRVTLGNRVVLGNYVKLGNYVELGDDVKLGDRVKLGYCVKLGDGITDARDLGQETPRGYGRAIAYHPERGVLFCAGCHNLTLTEAREHWGSPEYPDKDRGDAYLRLIDFAENEAKAMGWMENEIEEE